MNNFKKITLIDPLGQLPNLELMPGEGGYSRVPVDFRKSSGRTTAGATKVAARFYPSYFQWQINLNIVTKEKIQLFSIIFEHLTERLANPMLYPNPAYLLADEFRTVPVIQVGQPGRYSLITGSERPVRYAGNSLLGVTEGFGLFRVLLSVENEHIKEQTNCRSRLTFTAEEVY